MTEKEYLQKSAEIDRKNKALKIEQNILDELYIKSCAPYAVGTQLVVRKKYNRKTFVCWVVGYLVQYDKIVMIYNDVKKDGNRSKRQYMDNIYNLEMRLYDVNKDNWAHGVVF
jgi:hypothetical protein